MMKFRSLFFAGCAACFVASISCEGSDSKDTDASIRLEVEPGSDQRLERVDRSGTGTSDLLKRADAAFDEMNEAGRTKFETRVGLQPWPEDLRGKWPEPRGARVVADSMQRNGNRLLLVDLPDSPNEALERYRDELEASSYDVLRHESSPPAGHALHAKRGDDEAILSFFGREQVTRLEILFVSRGSG